MKLISKTLLGLSAASLLGIGTFTALGVAARASVDGYDHLKANLRHKFEVYVPVEVTKLVYGDPDISEIVKDSAERHGLPVVLIEAVMDVESGGKNTTRFEPRKYENDERAQSEFNRLMRNSSHGRMQVMGFNAASCGMTWQDLYQPQKGIDCGAKILRSCYDRATGKSEAEKLTQALGCYNGDPVRYPEKVKSALIDRLVSEKKVQFAMNVLNKK